MRMIAGFLLIIASFTGLVFFGNYTGREINYPVVWYLSFIAAGLIGIWLISLSLIKTKRIAEQFVSSRAEQIKSNSERIELNFENCVFKSGSFSRQVDDPQLRSAGLFVPGPVASMGAGVTETVIQSYLIYTETRDGAFYRFVSQSFPFDQATLKFYVLNHKIVLYVDRRDREKYLFELRG